MSDLPRHIQDVPDENSLLQAILPAQEKFRMTIRETALNFRFEGKRHMGRVTFLLPLKRAGLSMTKITRMKFVSGKSEIRRVKF